MAWLYSKMEKRKGFGTGGPDGTRMGVDQDSDEISRCQPRCGRRSDYMGRQDEGRRRGGGKRI